MNMTTEILLRKIHELKAQWIAVADSEKLRAGEYKTNKEHGEAEKCIVCAETLRAAAADLHDLTQ